MTATLVTIFATLLPLSANRAQVSFIGEDLLPLLLAGNRSWSTCTQFMQISISLWQFLLSFSLPEVIAVNIKLLLSGTEPANPS